MEPLPFKDELLEFMSEFRAMYDTLEYAFRHFSHFTYMKHAHTGRITAAQPHMPMGIASAEYIYLCKRKAFLLDDGWITSLGEYLMDLLDKRYMLFPPEEVKDIKPTSTSESTRTDEEYSAEIPPELLDEISFGTLHFTGMQYIGNKAEYQEQMQSKLMPRFVKDIYDYEYEGIHVKCNKTIWVHVIPRYRSELAWRQYLLEGYVEQLLDAIDRAEKYLKGAEIVYKKINGFLPY